MHNKHMTLIWLFLFLTTKCFCSDWKTDRKMELSRMKNYELIDDLSIDEDILTFTAFNHKYKLSLMVNEGIPATNGKLCHYFGKGSLYRAALSICDGGGVSGLIHTHNDTFFIKPSAYYLDIEFDGTNQYTLQDQHLLYRLSDYDSPLPLPRDLPHDLPHDIYNDNNDNSDHILNANRRRLRYNNGQSYIGMVVITDPPLYDYYGRNSGLVRNRVKEVINKVSMEYIFQDWGYNIGQITINLNEIVIMKSFTGVYKGLEPDWVNSRCTDWSNTKCEVFILSAAKKWANTYRRGRFDTYDTVQIISGYDFKGYMAGVANSCDICKGGSVAASMNHHHSSMSSQTYHHVAHELGHQLCMSHDWVVGCKGSKKIMAYDRSPQGFSSCSVKEIQSYFKANNGLKCLKSSSTAFIVETETPKQPECDESCIGIKDYNVNNGSVSDWLFEVYAEQQCSYYAYHKETQSTYYLHFENRTKYTDGSNGTVPWWIISKDSLLNEEIAYCNKKDIFDCINGWWYISQLDDDVYKYVMDKRMNSYDANGECPQGKERLSAAGKVVLVICCIVLLLVFVGIWWCIYNRMRKKKQSTDNIEEMAMAENDEMLEKDVTTCVQEIEVAVEN